MKFMHLGKRAAYAVLFLLVILAMALPVSAMNDPDSIELCKAVPVYYRASDASTVIGYMEHGTQLAVLEICGDYYRVDCYDMTGYIHKDFVRYSSREYYVNYRADLSGSSIFISRSLSASIPLRSRLYTYATEQIGVPYVSGGTSPRGFDCSGFTQYVYAQLGISIPRTCDGQLGAGIIISKESLQCGDLVLFQRTTGQSALATHVGIYLGDGKLIHAGGRGITVVDLDSQYFTEHYLCARRIIVSQKVEPKVSFTVITAEQNTIPLYAKSAG